MAIEVNTIYNMDALDFLKSLPSESVQAAITSPPYYNLRDYDRDDQLGNESTLNDYIDRLVSIFRELRRVLKNNGIFWLNIGDSYSQGSGDMPRKNVMLIPHRLFIACQDDGWIIRQDVVWHKPNAMPDSAKDRPSRSHEYIAMMVKAPKYYYDADAVKVPSKMLPSKKDRGKLEVLENTKPHVAVKMNRIARDIEAKPYRNRRSVWSITTTNSKTLHAAPFPVKLVEVCVLASTKPGDTVLDMFMGSGTTGLVSRRLGRNYIGSDVNDEYIDMAYNRINSDPLSHQQTLL